MCTNRIAFTAVLVAAVLAGPRIVGTGSLLLGSDRAPAVEIATVAPTADSPRSKAPDADSVAETAVVATLLENYLESSTLWGWIRTAATSFEEFVREAADFVGIDWPPRNMARRCS
jgi:hypothetical protein